MTTQGLETVKRLLKATARRNTAVACHLLRGHLDTELLWIVGNKRKFSHEGIVPTHVTERNILRAVDENNWNTGEAIAILASIAGMFHDFGKANSLFQNKLKGKSKKNHEPFRHEWISLLLFKHFVGNLSDKKWLEKLFKVSEENDTELVNNFPDKADELKKNPLKGLSKLAKFIGWLILSHHRLPVSVKGQLNDEPPLDKIDGWMDGKQFSGLWNSPQCIKDDWDNESIKQVRTFKLGTPFKSKSWCKRANKLAGRALSYFELLDKDWFKDRFSMHLIRASLMLSDHLFSAKPPVVKFQDPTYMAYANTCKKNTLKQKLDEHNMGVSQDAFYIARMLPKLHEALPSVSNRKSKEFKKRSSSEEFLWQNHAYDLAYSLKSISNQSGFFGINLASTGCGKTLANAKIMHGISDNVKGCRFSIALGLRVLTLQTGEALKSRLRLESDDLAVMIGSKAFQELYEDKNLDQSEKEAINRFIGSESLDDLEEENYIDYEGSLDDGVLSQILNSKPNLHKMICAPILVSTIDYLISATESKKGGKQIGPILRLLTSDLVLDEPDDFDIADLPALCRLVNFAGVFGSRVLLSSATLPPAILKALFDSYAAGRKEFNKACQKEDLSPEICCAWFDEFGVMSGNHADAETFISSHEKFIQKRLSNLDRQPILRRGELIPVAQNCKETDVALEVANTIKLSIYNLHNVHHQIHSVTGKRISVGIVRMANIDPMVAVAKELLSQEVKQDYSLHFCVYHSRFTMIVRSKIEEVLDRILTRHNPNLIWEMPEVQSALSKSDASNHIFVVIATAVAEVGRDHDYDWAIVEPSSMRSIIQLAGRVQRHRKIPPTAANVRILQHNIKGLKGSKVAFNRPGFESEKYSMTSKDLSLILHPYQFENITAKPRLSISDNMDYKKNLVDLEHTRLQAALLGNGKSPFFASLWWQSNADWCGEIQRHSPFRKSDGIETEYIAYIEEEGDAPEMHEWPRDGHLIKVENRDFQKEHFKPAQGNYFWIDCNVASEIEKRALKCQLTPKEISLKFARVTLRLLEEGKKWSMNQFFGFYQSQ